MCHRNSPTPISSSKFDKWWLVWFTDDFIVAWREKKQNEIFFTDSKSDSGAMVEDKLSKGKNGRWRYTKKNSLDAWKSQKKKFFFSSNKIYFLREAFRDALKITACELSVQTDDEDSTRKGRQKDKKLQLLSKSINNLLRFPLTQLETKVRPFEFLSCREMKIFWIDSRTVARTAQPFIQNRKWKFLRLIIDSIYQEPISCKQESNKKALVSSVFGCTVVVMAREIYGVEISCLPTWIIFSVWGFVCTRWQVSGGNPRVVATRKMLQSGRIKLWRFA